MLSVHLNFSSQNISNPNCYLNIGVVHQWCPQWPTLDLSLLVQIWHYPPSFPGRGLKPRLGYPVDLAGPTVLQGGVHQYCRIQQRDSNNIQYRWDWSWFLRHRLNWNSCIRSNCTRLHLGDPFFLLFQTPLMDDPYYYYLELSWILYLDQSASCKSIYTVRTLKIRHLQGQLSLIFNLQKYSSTEGNNGSINNEHSIC